jgi:hypothetical protein
MPTTPRPLKANNHATYQGEVASGKLDIIDAELDKDLDTLYDLVNGSLDNANIAANAAIAYSKLSLTGQVKGSDIAAGANISGAAIQPRTLPADRLVASSLTTAELANASVTRDKIAIAQTVQDIKRVEVSAVNMTSVNVFYLVAETTWNARGGLGWGAGVVHCVMGIRDVAPNPAIEALLIQDGAAGTPGTNGTIVDSVLIDQLDSGFGGTVVVPVTLVLQSLTWTTAGTHRLQICVTPRNWIAGYARVKAGYLSVVEWA